MKKRVLGPIQAPYSFSTSVLLFLILFAILIIGASTGKAAPLVEAISRPTLAVPEYTASINGVGDIVPRIQCPARYSARIYAEGLSSPDGLALNPSGALYVAEETAGQVSRVEVYGGATPIITGLSRPEGIAFDDTGNLYVVEDVQGGRVIKMTKVGVTETLATDRDAPEGVVWAEDGTLYITESNVEFTQNPGEYLTRITAISSGGAVTTLRSDALFWSYAGITIGPDGSLYVTNEASGTGTDDSVFAVNPTTGSRSLFVSGLVAPEGLRFAANDGFPLYVAEENAGGGSGRLRRVEVDGSHEAFCTGFQQIEDTLLDKGGRLYVSEDTSGSIVRIESGPPNRAHPRAIILFIGDGVGESHRIAARWSAVGVNGVLAMDTLPYGGWTRTASANDAVTDSAAATTAIATGFKTDNGVIGQDPDGNPLTTILERAKARGLAVGLVTDTQMAHATPAAFAAHVVSRTMMTEIASQMLETGVDVLLGGGEGEFLPTTTTGCYPQPGKRTDGRNLIEEAVSAGYTYVCDGAGLAGVGPTSTTRLLGLFGDEGMTRPFSPSLAEMTQKAIDILSQDPDGFFLMVEGGQIDWAAHASDAANVISDTIRLDEAIGVAQAYSSSAGDSLIIVTADHETGGMSVALTSSGAPGEDGPFVTPGGTPFYVNWTIEGHTDADVPTTAQGPWSDLLMGTYENTYIHDVMRMALVSAPAITLTQAATPPVGSSVRPGNRITYTLTLTNSGTADATGPALTDALPAGVSYVPGSARTASGLKVAATPPPALVFTGTLPANHTMTTTFAVTVSSVPSGTLLVNTAQLMANGLDPVISTATHQVVAIPNLSITKTAKPGNGSFVEPGDPITYTIVAHNSGDIASHVVLSDTLDLAQVTLAFSQATNGALSGPNPVQVTGLDLEPGQSVTLTLGVMVTGAVSGTVIGNRASINSAETPSPRFSAEVTHVISRTDVLSPSFVLVKRAEPPGGASVAQGDTLTYTLVAYNVGGGATNVLLTDTIPAGTAYVSDSAKMNLGEAEFDGAQVIFGAPNFAAGAMLTATFRVTLTSTAIRTITNTAFLSSSETAPEASNSISHPVKEQVGYSIFLPVLWTGFTLPALAPGRQ